MIEIRNQDLLTVNADVICHQVNCQGVMGSGIAKTISDKWPWVKRDYLEQCSLHKPQELLGKWFNTYVRDSQPFLKGKTILSIFGQLNYGRDKSKVYTDYTALEIAFGDIAGAYKDEVIAFPYKFGCGLANGDWNIVYKLIDDCFKNCNVIICKL